MDDGGTSEDGRPVVLDADDRPAAHAGLLQCLLGATLVIELALAIVVEDEQSKERLVLVPREVEHRDVTVRIPGSEERSAADAAPDAKRLLRAVVEIVGLCLAHD